MTTIENIIERIYDYAIPAAVVTAGIVIISFLLYILMPKKDPAVKIRGASLAWKVCRTVGGIWFAILASFGLTYILNVILVKTGETSFYLPAKDAIEGIIVVSLISFCFVYLAQGIFHYCFMRRKKCPKNKNQTASSSPET